MADESGDWREDLPWGSLLLAVLIACGLAVRGLEALSWR